MNAFAHWIDRLDGPAPRVHWRDGYWTGTELAARVRHYADVLVREDARVVASRLDNGPAWIALDLAIRIIDRVHVPLPTFFSPAQVAHALADSGADALVVPADATVASRRHSPLDETLSLHRLAATPAVLPVGTATITYTSGTTGTPRGVCLGVDALLAVATSLAEATAPLAPRRHLCLMPLSTLLENVAGVYAAMLAEAGIVAPPLAEIGYTGAAGLDVPALLACLHRYRPESVILLPQLLLALVMAGERGALPPDSLKCLAVGGGRVGPALIARAGALGLPVYEGYGLSECASVVCFNRPGAVRPGSVGRPLPHARVSVRDGELFVDGPHLLGYLGGDAAATDAGIATGDLGHIDADGFVHVTGRRKHVFITAFGRNVSPEWVESELLQHPAIAQAVVHGEARPFNVAIVWPHDPALDDDALRRALDAVNDALPDYARIEDVIRADAPFSAADGLLTANGRPRRDAILDRYRDAVDARYADAMPHTRGVTA